MGTTTKIVKTFFVKFLYVNRISVQRLFRFLGKQKDVNWCFRSGKIPKSVQMRKLRVLCITTLTFLRTGVVI